MADRRTSGKADNLDRAARLEQSGNSAGCRDAVWQALIIYGRVGCFMISQHRYIGTPRLFPVSCKDAARLTDQ